MSMAPVAAAISGNSFGATKSKTQSIAWPGPAMKPSSDIDLFTTTLPFPALVSLNLFLRRPWDVPVMRSGACLAAILVFPLPPDGVRFESFGRRQAGRQAVGAGAGRRCQGTAPFAGAEVLVEKERFHDI